MAGVCLTCGRIADIEAHHVAGRRNHDVTSWVCVDCHRILSVWQRAAGIELRDVETSETDRVRALLVGTFHLARMLAERHPEETWFIPGWLAIHTARAVSRALDLQQLADRIGRWLPDPTVPPTHGPQVAWRAATEAERLAEIAHLGGALCKMTEKTTPLAATIAGIAEKPAGWIDTVKKAAAQDPVFVTTLHGLAVEYRKLCEAMAANLLQVDHPDDIDAVLLGEVTAWHDRLVQVIDQLDRITGWRAAS
jgi:hypothetical protein